MRRYPPPLDRLPYPVAESILGMGGGSAGIAPSAGFSVAATSDTTGKHLQRATTWTLPTKGILMWYGAIDAIYTPAANAAAGFLIGHIGASSAESGAFVAVDSTGQIVTFGRRNAVGGGGASFGYDAGVNLVDSSPRLYWAAWGWSGWGSDLARVGIGPMADGDYAANTSITTKTGPGNQPSFLARNTTIVGDGSVAATQAWAAMVGRELTSEEWTRLSAGDLTVLDGASDVNFAIYPAVSGAITDPAHVADYGSDGGDWNDTTRGTGAVEIQGVGL